MWHGGTRDMDFRPLLIRLKNSLSIILQRKKISHKWVYKKKHPLLLNSFCQTY